MSTETKPSEVQTVPNFHSVPTLRDGLRWVSAELLSKGVPIEASRIWYDRFKKPRNPMVKVLGMSPRAEAAVKRIAPGGQWNIEVWKNPNGFYQLSAWYSKFAVYAYAMTRAEEGFECTGIDFTSINAFYRTCMGFANLGLGEANLPDKGYERIEGADVDLFSQIYATSGQIWAPSLPFDEVFRPCAVFLAVRNPKLFAKQFCRKTSGYYRYFEHTKAVLDNLHIPLPQELAHK